MIVLFSLVLTASCGDDTTGPTAPEPVVLTLEFTGDSTDTGSLFSSNSVRRASLSTLSQNSLADTKYLCEITASWTTFDGDDFDYYVLYRSLTSGISGDSSGANVVCLISDIDSIVCADTDVEWDETYYYAVMVITGNDESWSNEETITTPAEPAAITLSAEFTGDPLYPDEYCEITADWTIYTEGDFLNYVLYRSLYPDISGDPSAASILGVFNDQNTTEYIDTDIVWEMTYYYAVKINITDGEIWSNEIEIATPQQPTCPPDSLVAEVELGGLPRGLSSSPSGEFVYVTDAQHGLLYVIRTSDNAIVDTVDVNSWPYKICVLPSGEFLYISHRDYDCLSVVRTSDNTMVETVAVGDWPSGMCALPSGDYLYVTNSQDDNVMVIRTSDNTVVETIEAGKYPQNICSLPSGDFVYVANGSSYNTVTVIRTSDNTVVKTIEIDGGAGDICPSISGDYVYVTSSWHDDVKVIRTSDNTVVAEIDVGSGPCYICSLPSGGYVYVSNRDSDDISVIRTSDNIVAFTIDTYNLPEVICALPSGEYVYVAHTAGDYCLTVYH